MTAIPTYRVTWPAASTAYWLVADSPTTQKIGTTSGDATRMIVWSTAGGMPSALYSSKVMYSLLGFRLVTGNPGRSMNWHNQPNDSPWGWTPYHKNPSLGGVRTGVSVIAIDYFNTRGLEIVIQGEQGSGGEGPHQFQIFTQAQAEARRGQWIWIWIKVELGRWDSLPDGSLQLWVAGEDVSPRISVSNINTHWWGQHQVTYWQGGYWSNNTTPAGGVVIEHALARFGRTPQECYEDVPVYFTEWGATQTGSGGPGSATLITARQHDEAVIPDALDWGAGGGGDPAPAPELAANTRDRRFGKSAQGVDRPTLTGDFKRGSKFGTNLGGGEEADVYDFHIYLGGNDGSASTQKVTLGIYDDDGAAGGPGTKLGECDLEIELAGTAVSGWRKVTSSSPIRITGEFVWLVAGSSTPSARLLIASDQSVEDGLAANPDTYDASAPRLASPFGTIYYSFNEMTICVDYDVVVIPVETPARTTAIARTSDVARASNVEGRIAGLGGGGL